MRANPLARAMTRPMTSASTRAITAPGVGGGGWTPQPGDYLLNETGLFLTDEFGNQLTV